MRKHLFQIYNLLSSYPILVLLVFGIGALVYIGGQYKPLELKQARQLEALMQLKQKQTDMEAQLKDVEIVDLAKRYTLFNQDFLDPAALEGDTLADQIGANFRAYGWDLQALEQERVNTAPEVSQNTVRITGVSVQTNAVSMQTKQADGEPFLPLYSATQALRFMWLRAPTKEYKRVKLSRLEDGYRFEASIFLPLQDTANTNKPDQEAEI